MRAAEFARRGARQAGLALDEHDPAVDADRILDGLLDVSEQRFPLGLLGRMGLDDDDDRLGTGAIDREGAGVTASDLGQRFDCPFDVLWPDIAAIDDDEVLGASGDHQFAVVPVAQVAGIEPAVAQHARALVGFLEVARHHTGAAHKQAADAALAQDCARLVADFHRMSGQDLAADHEVARPARLRIDETVDLHAGERWCEAQSHADLGHAVARHEGALVEACRLEGFGEAAKDRKLDHVGPDACKPQARQVEFGEGRGLRPARQEVVAEARAVGDGRAATRDQRKPLHRPPGEVARGQQVDGALRAHRREDEADQAHVVIERQPANARIGVVQSLRGDRSVDVRHELVLTDVDAQRHAGAARRELDVASHAGTERP